MADIAKLVEELSKLTVLEAAELATALEEEWGVSAAAAVAVASGGPVGRRLLHGVALLRVLRENRQRAVDGAFFAERPGEVEKALHNDAPGGRVPLADELGHAHGQAAAV